VSHSGVVDSGCQRRRALRLWTQRSRHFRRLAALRAPRL